MTWTNRTPGGSGCAAVPILLNQNWNFPPHVPFYPARLEMEGKEKETEIAGMGKRLGWGGNSLHFPTCIEGVPCNQSLHPTQYPPPPVIAQISRREAIRRVSPRRWMAFACPLSQTRPSSHSSLPLFFLFFLFYFACYFLPPLPVRSARAITPLSSSILVLSLSYTHHSFYSTYTTHVHSPCGFHTTLVAASPLPPPPSDKPPLPPSFLLGGHRSHSIVSRRQNIATV